MNWKFTSLLLFLALVLIALYVVATPTPVSSPSDSTTTTTPSVETEQTDDTAENMEVVIYAYDLSRDMDENGNVLCSSTGLVPLSRTIPQTSAPLTPTLELLLSGSLTEEERARGLTTEFPLNGVTLEGVVVEDGTAVISINDPQNSTSGGSCRVSILSMQIERTATQFPTVTDIRFESEEIFQP